MNNMNQISVGEIYKNEPNNYILRGKGGFGKTTQLKAAQRFLLGRKIPYGTDERTCVPIYLDMSDVNRCLNTIDAEYLYKVLIKYFNNTVTDVKQIKHMLKDREYQFIFLLDAINEIAWEKGQGDRVYSCLVSNIDDIFRENAENVHFIISTREGCSLFGSPMLEDNFVQLKFDKLGTSQIDEFLEGQNEEYGGDVIDSLLSNPMLLSMYRDIKKENPDFVLTQKYELIKAYVHLDRDFKATNRYYDGYHEVRKKLIDIVLPHIAYRIEKCLLECISIENLGLEELILDVAEEEELDDIITVLNMTKLVDENLRFSHQMIREYFASQNIKQISTQDELDKFFSLLTEFFRYKKKQDFDRRTKYLDLGEFIYAIYQNRVDTLIDRYSAQDFVQELAGVYDDLKERNLAGKIAQEAYQMLLALDAEDDLDKAVRLNFLGYTILNSYGDCGQSMELFVKAKKIIDSMELPKSPKDAKKYHEVKGAVLNNYGAYYYKLKEYDKAEKWHNKSLVHREHYDRGSVMGSFRALMSDCYMQGKYSDAYRFYLDGMKYMGDGKKHDLADFMERALGSEVELYFDPECDQAFTDKLRNEMYEQIEMVFNNAIGKDGNNQRIYRDGLKNLKQKMQKIIANGEGKKKKDELVEYAEQMLVKIENVL